MVNSQNLAGAYSISEIVVHTHHLKEKSGDSKSKISPVLGEKQFYKANE